MKLFCVIMSVLLFGCSANLYATDKQPPILFMVGDSTMAIKLDEKRPETGWGEKLVAYFQPRLKISNHAMNGRSSKSFRDEGRWQAVLNQLQPGDYVFIQFGHNDQKVNDPARFTNPYSSYRANLQSFVEETRAKHAIPVLLSSIVRRNFNEQGTLVDTHGPYPAVVRQLANELEVAFIDLHTLSERLVSERGANDSRELYLHLQPGEHVNYPQGVEDNTHLNPAGADAIAGLVASQLCQSNLPLKKYLRSCE